MKTVLLAALALLGAVAAAMVIGMDARNQARDGRRLQAHLDAKLTGADAILARNSALMVSYSQDKTHELLAELLLPRSRRLYFGLGLAGVLASLIAALLSLWG